MVRLERAGPGDAAALLKIQRQAFAALLEKYQDYDTNPAAESLEWMQWRLDNPERDCWFILANGKRVGLVCTKPVENGRSISPIGLVPEFQGQGIGSDSSGSGIPQHTPMGVGHHIAGGHIVPVL